MSRQAIQRILFDDLPLTTPIVGDTSAHRAGVALQQEGLRAKSGSKVATISEMNRIKMQHCLLVEDAETAREVIEQTNLIAKVSRVAEGDTRHGVVFLDADSEALFRVFYSGYERFDRQARAFEWFPDAVGFFK